MRFTCHAVPRYLALGVLFARCWQARDSVVGLGWLVGWFVFVFVCAVLCACVCRCTRGCWVRVQANLGRHGDSKEHARVARPFYGAAAAAAAAEGEGAPTHSPATDEAPPPQPVPTGPPSAAPTNDAMRQVFSRFFQSPGDDARRSPSPTLWHLLQPLSVHCQLTLHGRPSQTPTTTTIPTSAADYTADVVVSPVVVECRLRHVTCIGHAVMTSMIHVLRRPAATTQYTAAPLSTPAASVLAAPRQWWKFAVRD